jgi:hypothetical protein
LHHRQSTTLESHQIEESATVVECNAVLHFDQLGGPTPIFEYALFDLYGAIGWSDQQARCVRYRIAHAFDDGAKVPLVVFDR